MKFSASLAILGLAALAVAQYVVPIRLNDKEMTPFAKISAQLTLAPTSAIASKVSFVVSAASSAVDGTTSKSMDSAVAIVTNGTGTAKPSASSAKPSNGLAATLKPLVAPNSGVSLPHSWMGIEAIVLSSVVGFAVM